VDKPEVPRLVVVEKPVEKPVENVVEKVIVKAPEKPQMIRIVGLDEGTREIVLPAARPEKQN
jgi:hypothetical protein